MFHYISGETEELFIQYILILNSFPFFTTFRYVCTVYKLLISFYKIFYKNYFTCGSITGHTRLDWQIEANRAIVSEFDFKE